MLHRLPVFAVLMGWACLACAASAQEIPTDPTRWINSPPLTKEMLAGKAAVFYFLEEECPKCAAAWPATLGVTGKFEGQPIVFIAVNSGTSRPQFETYLRQHRITWPAINDWDRSFEKQFGFQISLQNIMQARVLQPDGKFKAGNAGDMGATSTDAVATAKWRVEPKDIPSNMREAWLAVEFGTYPGAARSITRGLAGKGPQADAAQKLNTIVMDDLTARVAAAQKSLDDGKAWAAFKGFSAIPVNFKGFEIPADVATRVTELTKHDDVKKEQTAQKLLAKAQLTASKSPNNLKGAIKQLEAVAKTYSETEAGMEAQKYLDLMNAPPEPIGTVEGK